MQKFSDETIIHLSIAQAGSPVISNVLFVNSPEHIMIRTQFIIVCVE